MKKITVLLVDDHHLFRQGIKDLLMVSGEIEVIAEANNGLEALAKSKQFQPDVVLMDLSMPDMDGLQATRKLLEELPRLKVVVLSAFKQEESIFQAFKFGARAYLPKNRPSGDLINVIKRVYNEEIPINAEIAEVIINITKKENIPQGLLKSSEELRMLEMVERNLGYMEIAGELLLTEERVRKDLNNVLHRLRSVQ